MKNQTSNGAVLRVAASGFVLGALVTYNRVYGFELPYLVAYAIVLVTGIGSYIFLRKGMK